MLIKRFGGLYQTEAPLGSMGGSARDPCDMGSDELKSTVRGIMPSSVLMTI